MTCWRRVGLLLLLSGAGLIGRASAQTPTGAAKPGIYRGNVILSLVYQ